MHVKFSNGIEVKTSNTITGWSWRQDYTRAWYAIHEDSPLVKCAIAHFQQRDRNRLCSPEHDRDMSRCLC